MDDSALHAIMDAQLLTTLRTGASSAVATHRLARGGTGTVAVIGSGREAFNRPFFRQSSHNPGKFANARSTVPRRAT